MRALFCVFALCLAIIFNTGGSVAQQPLATSFTQVTVGKMNLFGDFWDVLNLQGVSPSTRTELRIFPSSGGPAIGQPDPVGGEITIAAEDLTHLNSTGDYHDLAIYSYNQEYRIQSQSGGNATPYPIKFDSMGGFINLSLNTDGSLGISRGISNTEGAGGFAHERMPACPPPLCSMQLNWQTKFGNTNYTATCTLGGALGTVNWTQKSDGFLILSVRYFYGSQTGGEVDCVGIHD